MDQPFHQSTCVFSINNRHRLIWPLSATPEKPAGAGLEIMTVLAVLTMCAFTYREIMMETVNGIL